jgi:hypothetical protein
MNQSITIVTTDNVSFSVRPEIIKLIPTLQEMCSMIEHDEIPSIPLPNITSSQFSKILEYLEKHKDDEPLKQDYLDEFILTDISLITDWDKELVAEYSQEELEEFLLVVNFLNIRRLLDVCTNAMAHIFDKLPEAEFEALCKEVRARAPKMPEEETASA